MWRCPACDKWLPEAAFSMNSYSQQRPHSHCKECDNERSRWRRRTLRGSLLQLVWSARCRAKRKPWNATLTFQDLLQMVERQNGRCSYSGVPMELCMSNSHWRMSLERLNNSKGYSCQNCVLVVGEFNTGDYSRQKGVVAQTVNGSAQWSSDKVQDVFHLRDQPLDIDLLAKDIAEAKLRPTRQKV